MTHEEIHKLHCDMKSGVLMVTEKLGEVGKTKSTWSLSEMCEVAKTMKYLSGTLKNLSKANYYSEMKSDERY